MPSAPQSARMCPWRPARCVPGPAPACLQTAPPCARSALLRRHGFAALPPRLRTGACAAAVPDARRGRSHTTGYGPALLRPPRRSDAHRGDRPQARASVLPRARRPGDLRRQPADGRVRPIPGKLRAGLRDGSRAGLQAGGQRSSRAAAGGLFGKKHAIPRPLTARAGPPCTLSQYTDKLQKVFTAYLLLFCKNKLYLSKNISRHKVSAKLHINC